MTGAGERPLVLQTGCGPVRGVETDRCRRFLGVPYARADRFCYAEPVTRWPGELDAVRPGNACPQNRAVHEHLEHPTRRFYKREYREGIAFSYSEDCLNLNIYAPGTGEMKKSPGNGGESRGRRSYERGKTSPPPRSSDTEKEPKGRNVK